MISNLSTLLCATLAGAAKTKVGHQIESAPINKRSNEFVQVWQDRTRRHGCSTAHDMLKDSRNQFNLADWQSGDRKFSDPFFPTTDAVYWADVEFEARSLIASQAYDLQWHRAGDIYQDGLLWGPRGIIPGDIAQGDLGNCWLMAAISAYAEYPSRIHDVFHNTQANPAGLYGLNIYALGVPTTVWIDDYIGFKTNQWTGEMGLFYGQVGSDNALWGPLIEKALAKSVGNFWHLDTGINADGVSMLNGGPYEELRHYDPRMQMSVDDFWNKINHHDALKQIMTVKSNQSRGGKFIENHSYVILGTKQLNSGERLVLLRNPWGEDMYTSQWSDSDGAWTHEKVQQRDIPLDERDGLFYVRLEDFFAVLDATFINYDTSEWFPSYFLMLDDPAQKTGRDRNCGKQCTRHKLTVTSQVDQYIWVGAHTYRYYSYADDPTCPAHTSDPLLAQLGKQSESQDKRKHVFFNKKERSAQPWQAGDIWSGRMYVTAGESFTVEVEFNWNRSGITRDWSVTAWGESGPVSVTHDQGIATDSLPFTPKAGQETQEKYNVSPPKPVQAHQGEPCEGFNEVTGQAFPQCASGLLCVNSGGFSIPGAGNACITQQEANKRASQEQARQKAEELALEKAKADAKLAAEEQSRQAHAAAEAERVAVEQAAATAEAERLAAKQAASRAQFAKQQEDESRKTGLVVEEEFDNAYNRPTGLVVDRLERPRKVENLKFDRSSFDISKYQNKFNRPTGLGRSDPPTEKPRTPPAEEEQTSFGSYKRSDGLKAFTSNTTPAATSKDESSDDSTGGWASYLSKWRTPKTSTSKSTYKPRSTYKPKTYKPFDFSSKFDFGKNAFDVSKYLTKPKKAVTPVVTPPPTLDTKSELNWLENLTSDMPDDAPSTPRSAPVSPPKTSDYTKAFEPLKFDAPTFKKFEYKRPVKKTPAKITPPPVKIPEPTPVVVTPPPVKKPAPTPVVVTPPPVKKPAPTPVAYKPAPKPAPRPAPKPVAVPEKVYDTLAPVTQKAYFDIEIGGKPAGRIIFGLFGSTTPITAQNFATLAEGGSGLTPRGLDLSYAGSEFHRIIPGFMAQGGDYTHGNGSGGYSIYGVSFDDENFKLTHDKPYLLSMANSGPDTNGSQFFITFKPTAWLNGKHTVFGEVLEGQKVVEQMQRFGTRNGDTRKSVVIAASGLLD